MIMKKIRIISYAVIAFVTMSFAACTQNEDIAPTWGGQEIDVSFIVGGVQTRTNILDRGDCWEDGDSIRVQAFAGDSTGYALFTFSNSNGIGRWSRDRQFCWLDLNSNHTIWASYPCDCECFSFELPAEQETLKKLKKADYMNGLWQGDPYDNTIISIQMQHRMSIVTVDYEIGSSDFEGSPSPTKVEVLSKNYQVKFDAEGKNPSLTGGEKWVTAHLHDGNKFSAIVTPGKYQANEVFMRITLNGKEYNVSTKIDTKFYEGYRHQFHLKMGKKKCDLVPVSEDNLSGWTTEEELK